MRVSDNPGDSKGPSRREALSMIGVGCGIISLSGGTRTALAAAKPNRKKLVFPKGAIIRTVLKDLAPDELGAGTTLFHEHIASDTIDELVIEEVSAARKDGITCIVNPKAFSPFPNIANLRTISTRTNMHIVACGGYYIQSTFPSDFATRSEDQIAEDLILEANRDGFGAFGEIGQSPNSSALTPDELKAFHAVGKAHMRTNLPIFTHTPYGTGPNVIPEAGLRQLDAFESVGVKPERVVIGHTCCLDDPKAEIIQQIAKRGAFVGFDRMIDRHAPLPPGSPPRPDRVRDTSDEQRVTEILEFIEAGYVDHLLLADDSTAKPLKVSEEIKQMAKEHWLTEDGGETMRSELYQAMGLGRTISVFVPKLRKAGVKEETLHTILHDNPLRFLAFEPKGA